MFLCSKNNRKLSGAALSGVVCVCGWFLLPEVEAEQCNRANIQRFFTQDQGNSIRNQHWHRQYMNQTVTWQGKVFRIERRSNSQRYEILVKVLPETPLYDTVVVLEGINSLPMEIQKRAILEFTGRIFNGVDAVGVKEVHVLVPSVSHLRLITMPSSYNAAFGKEPAEKPTGGTEIPAAQGEDATGTILLNELPGTQPKDSY